MTKGKNMLQAIWAQSQDGIIGDGLDIPWYIPEDFQHFKTMTQGNNVIMGRKTWESLPKKPLPKRNNYILSSQQPSKWSQDAYVINNIDKTPEDGWIIGGSEIYRQYMDTIEVIEQTVVDMYLEGEVSNPVYAPKIPNNFIVQNESLWKTSHSPQGSLNYKFVTWKKI